MFKIRLKELRDNKGLSQREFAAAFGVSPATVGMWESGEREPKRLEDLQRIADFFDVTVDYLIGHEKKSPGVAEAAPEETHLIELYRELNSEGREKLLDYADDMVRSGKYIKIDSLGVGKKA